MSGTYVKAARADEVPAGGRLVVEVDERLIVLFNVHGQFYAIDDVCTHDDGPLSEGELHDYAVACPRHGAKFDIRSGAALTMPATRATGAYDVKVENGDVLIAIGAASSAAETTTATPVGQVAAAAPTVHQPGQEPTTPAASIATAPSGVPASDSAASPEAAGGPLSEDSVREALKQVIDPELFVNIVDLGLIYGVTLSDQPDGKSFIGVDMTMTSPACPAGPQLIQNSKDVIGRMPGVGGVDVKLVMIPPWTPDRMTEAARDQLGIF
ncbi:MAG: iron-sulfur cluster assembly protein [Pirellulales bacterium]